MRKLWLILTLLAASLVCLTPALAGQSDGFIASSAVSESGDQPQVFWTPEKISQALANPKITGKPGSGSSLGLSSELSTGAGTLLTAPGYCPDCSEESPAPAAPAFRSGATCPASPYEWLFDTDYGAYPQRVVGRLLFMTPSGELSCCTASLVEKRLLLTAGHCVSENGQWMQNIIFIPGYLDGLEPFGVGHAEWAITPSDWLHLEMPTRDVAFVRIQESLGDRLGWVGFMANAERSGFNWEQYGYPSEAPFDGSKLAKNTSAWGADDCTSGTPCPIGVGSIFTGGSSGGPWLKNRDGELFANGLNSYFYYECETTMYSPYFDQDVWELFEKARATQ